MTEINEVKEPTTEVTETPTKEELIKRYADIWQLSTNEAIEQVGAETVDEVLKNIEAKTLEKIHSLQPPLNRAQRRARAKKLGKSGVSQASTITDMATKLNYIDLIQRLRELNKKKEQMKNEDSNENNGSISD